MIIIKLISGYYIMILCVDCNFGCDKLKSACPVKNETVGPRTRTLNSFVRAAIAMAYNNTTDCDLERQLKCL